MLVQYTFLIGFVLIASFLGMWLRRFEMQGAELWLPLGILVSYAISPLAGFIVGFSVMIISFALFPYGLQWLVIMAATLGGTLYATAFLPVTAGTFVTNAMILVVAYNIVSNAISFFAGYDIFRIFKFVLLSLTFNWIIFSKLGWDIIVWLSR